MKDRIIYKEDSLNAAASELDKLEQMLSDVKRQLDAVDTSGKWWSKLHGPNSGGSALEAVNGLRADSEKLRSRSATLAKNVRRTVERFEEADAQTVAFANSRGVGKARAVSSVGAVSIAAAEMNSKPSKWSAFLKKFWEHYGWGGLLKGSKYIGKIFGFAQDIKNIDSWSDLYKTTRDVSKFIREAADTYKKYAKIGRCVGVKKSMTWWLKNITGWKPLGYTSKAKSFGKRFKNNLTNKTSPFNLRDAFGDLTGKAGVGKCVAAWTGVALDGVTNLFGNLEEQAASGGKMSNGRVVSETVMETIVGTAFTYGAEAVVGGAVATVLGTAAAPGLLVTAVTGAIIAGANAGIETLTGKTATEWASDAILDAAEAVGRGAKKVGSAVAGWFRKLKFA